MCFPQSSSHKVLNSRVCVRVSDDSNTALWDRDVVNVSVDKWPYVCSGGKTAQ